MTCCPSSSVLCPSEQPRNRSCFVGLKVAGVLFELFLLLTFGHLFELSAMAFACVASLAVVALCAFLSGLHHEILLPSRACAVRRSLMALGDREPGRPVIGPVCSCRAAVADRVCAIDASVGRKITRTTRTRDIPMSTANSASSTNRTTRPCVSSPSRGRQHASSQTPQFVALLQRPASTLPIYQAEQLSDDHADEQPAKNQGDQGG